MERGNILTIALFILGFVFLIKGADMLVSWASSTAKRFNISDMVIGLTIVAFGTSAPELVVNISSSLKGLSGIAIGNILGSNIANILLILGVSALLYPLKVQKKLLQNETVFTLIATLIFGLFINDMLIDGTSSMMTRSEGVSLLLLLGIFLYYIYHSIKQAPEEETQETSVPMPLWKGITWIILGLAGLVLWGEWIVNGAVWIAKNLGMSERIIGLTIIAVGTSLPELATSAIAAYKKNTDIALGNIIGSNIFNILFILGVSASISPIPSLPGTNWDLLVSIWATLLVFWFGYGGITNKKREINKREWGIMVLLYFLYLSYLVISSLW